MAALFRVLTTPAFERQARKAIRSKGELAAVLEKLIPILRDDPYNVTGSHKIKKLAGVDAGDGRLPKAERKKLEAQYHRMKPKDLDAQMSRAKRHSPGAIRLAPGIG